MNTVVRVFVVAVLLATLAACAGAPVYQSSAAPAGGYDFSAGDRSSPYPPYHHATK